MATEVLTQRAAQVVGGLVRAGSIRAGDVVVWQGRAELVERVVNARRLGLTLAFLRGGAAPVPADREVFRVTFQDYPGLAAGAADAPDAFLADLPGLPPAVPPL